MARTILAVLLLGSTAAALWAQSQSAALTGETHISIALIISVLGLACVVAGMWITSARATRDFHREWREAFVKLQQSVNDHHKQPHLTQADVEAKAAFYASNYASKELCVERHGDLDRRLDRIERSLEDLNSLIRQFIHPTKQV